MDIGYVSYTSINKSNNNFIIGTILCTDVELKELSLRKIESHLSKKYGGDYAVAYLEKLRSFKEAKKEVLKSFIGQFQNYLSEKHTYGSRKEPENGSSDSVVMFHIKYEEL